jgi:hypothetical protein
MESSSWWICHSKIQQKQTRDKKVTALEVRGLFHRKFSIEQPMVWSTEALTLEA